MSDLVPFICEDCKRELVYLCENLEEPVFLQHCTYEAIEVWCPECQQGFTFALKEGDRPAGWTCPDCHNEYRLPIDMYSKPVPLLDPSFIDRFRADYRKG